MIATPEIEDAYIEWYFGYPSIWELEKEYKWIYVSQDTPTDLAIGRYVVITDEFPLGDILLTEKLLDPRIAKAHGIMAVGTDTRRAVEVERILLYFKRSEPIEMHHERLGWAALIHPATRRGVDWQGSVFDADGPLTHVEGDSPAETITKLVDDYPGWVPSRGATGRVTGMKGNPVDLASVPSMLHGRMADAEARAIVAGADPETLEYVGAGMEGIVFFDEGFVYKVRNRHKKSGEAKKGRAARKTLENEAIALEALSEAGAPVPEFFGYHPGIDVIVRAFVEGRAGRWSDGRRLREVYEHEIVPALRAAEFTGGEFKEDSFIITPSGEASMVDLGMVTPIGQRAVRKLARDMEELSADSDHFDLQSDIRFSLSDGDISIAQATEWADALEEFGRQPALREAIQFHEKQQNPPYSGWRPSWWNKKLPKNTHKVRYTTKRDALNVFLDWNRAIIDDYGGVSMKHSPDSFDAINHYYGTQADTIARAVWAALPPGSPYYLEDINVDLLNQTAPAVHNRRGRTFSLPDFAEEQKLLDREREYWETRYREVFPSEDDVPF